MSKLYNATSGIKKRQRNFKRNRFYTALDMAMIKHDVATDNAQKKRGEKEDKGNNRIVHCGCGAVGCFLHITYDNR